MPWTNPTYSRTGIDPIVAPGPASTGSAGRGQGRGQVTPRRRVFGVERPQHSDVQPLLVTHRPGPGPEVLSPSVRDGAVAVDYRTVIAALR